MTDTSISPRSTTRSRRDARPAPARRTASTRVTTTRRESPPRRAAVSRKRRPVRSAASRIPPVLVRGGYAGYAAAAPRPGQKSRRRFDVALNVPGAELHLPALPTIQIGWRLLSGLLSVILAVAIYYLWNSPAYQVNQIEFAGLQRLTSREINATLSLPTAPIFAFDSNRVLNDLRKNFPELYNMSIAVELPAKVTITVEERQPLLAWRQDDRTYWVDAQGVMFPPRGDEELPLVVNAEAGVLFPALVEAELETQLLTPELVETILKLRSVAPEGAELVFTQEHGLGWLDPRGWTTYIGMDLKDIDMRLKIYKAITMHVRQNKLQPVMISVEFLHAPYYRLNK